MIVVRYLSLFGLFAAAQNGWCGQAECADKPQCSNTAVDIMVALDQSCSMTASDFTLEGNFSTALAAAAEKRFNVSRFAGAQFGFAVNFTARPIPVSSKIFAHMQAGASAFAQSVPVIANAGNFTSACGGTPTDEAVLLFFSELNATRVKDRMQVAILLTDGQPTLCSTAGGNCDGTSNSITSASAAATAERWNSTKLPSLGTLVFTIGIGASVNTQLLTNFSSSPRMFFQATNFAALVTNTLPQVLDQLCFYFITGTSSCPSSGQVFRIKAYNFFPLASPAKCRFQEIGTSNYYYSTASINVTTEKFLNETGLVSYVTCSAPNVSYDFSAMLEISREGVYYTSNEFKTVVRRQCNVTSAPLCPGAALENFFHSCNESEFSNSACTTGCAQASVALGNAFQSPDFLFTAATISECIMNFPGNYSSSARAVVANLTKSGKGPCPQGSGGDPTTSGASFAVPPVMGLVLFLAASFF